MGCARTDCALGRKRRCACARIERFDQKDFWNREATYFAKICEQNIRFDISRTGTIRRQSERSGALARHVQQLLSPGYVAGRDRSARSRWFFGDDSKRQPMLRPASLRPRFPGHGQVVSGEDPRLTERTD